jgi:type I restriction enzyme S subunit
MRLEIIDVPDTLIKKFEDLAEPIFGEIRVLKNKNQNLRQTRDLLLPKLISGKIDVSELDIDTGDIET